MIQILKKYDDGEFEVTEYTKDGVTVSHVVKALKSSIDLSDSKPVVEDTLGKQIDSLTETVNILLRMNLEKEGIL